MTRLYNSFRSTVVDRSPLDKHVILRQIPVLRLGQEDKRRRQTIQFQENVGHLKDGNSAQPFRP